VFNIFSFLLVRQLLVQFTALLSSCHCLLVLCTISSVLSLANKMMSQTVSLSIIYICTSGIIDHSATLFQPTQLYLS